MYLGAMLALAIETVAAIANRMAGQEYLVEGGLWVRDCFMVFVYC